MSALTDRYPQATSDEALTLLALCQGVANCASFRRSTGIPDATAALSRVVLIDGGTPQDTEQQGVVAVDGHLFPHSDPHAIVGTITWTASQEGSDLQVLHGECLLMLVLPVPLGSPAEKVIASVYLVGCIRKELADQIGTVGFLARGSITPWVGSLPDPAEADGAEHLYLSTLTVRW